MIAHFQPHDVSWKNMQVQGKTVQYTCIIEFKARGIFYSASITYRELHRSQICMFQTKKRQMRDNNDGNEQYGRQTETMGLDMVLFSRPCICDPRDNGISWHGKSPMDCTVPSPWKLIMEQKSPNAILNEMSHPKKCHMNQCPSLLQTQSEEFLSQWRKDL